MKIRERSVVIFLAFGLWPLTHCAAAQGDSPGADPKDEPISTPADQATQDASLKALTTAKGKDAGPGDLLGKDRDGLSEWGAKTTDNNDLLRKMFAAVVVVLILGGLALLVFKKVLPRIGRPAGRTIQVQETAYLGPKKTVHLLQVSDRQFLIASTRDRISLLAEITPGQKAPQTTDESDT